MLDVWQMTEALHGASPLLAAPCMHLMTSNCRMMRPTIVAQLRLGANTTSARVTVNTCADDNSFNLNGSNDTHFVVTSEDAAVVTVSTCRGASWDTIL